MKLRVLQLAALAALFLRGGAAAADAAENPYHWQPRVRTATIFKNGLGFFVREGETSLRDGWCLAGPLPPAAFGTLAVYALREGETVETVVVGPGETVAFDGIDAPDDADARRERLAAALFLNLHLTWQDREEGKRAASGTLIAVGPDHVVLQGEEHAYAAPLAQITEMQVLDYPLRVQVSGAESAPPSATALGMAYLRQGITWVPEYTLELLDGETARLTLRGTVVNEAEDLVGSDLNLMVGVPGFRHTDYLAPAAVGQVIRTIGRDIAPRQVMSQVMSRAAIARDTRADQPPGLVEQPVPEGGRPLREATGALPGLEEHAGATDFTVYSRPDITLRTGEKAVLPLFSRAVGYGHLYRWSPPGEIRHHLVLHNDTGTPWTTGPCLITSGGLPLGEDLLYYVPAGGRGELPVTTAINIAHEQEERETDREIKAHEPRHNQFYDLVTLAGRLTVRNYEAQAIDLAVDLSLAGTPETASADGAISLDAEALRLLERRGRISWRLKVPPGDTATLTYTYRRYVPSH